MKMISVIKPLLLLLLIIINLSCADNDIWRLVWSDEFDYEGEPDPAKWTIVERHARRIVAESYENNRENVRVENGNLIIQAHSKRSRWYTTGKLDTYISGNWTYGRIEIKAKLPKAVEHCPQSI
jgi:beta-glucanase (GH16 family)